MRATMPTVIALLLVSACLAQERPELVLRNPHYFVVVGDGQTAPTITVECRSFFSSAAGMNLEVTDPMGMPRLKLLVPVGESITRSIPGPPADLYLVSVDMGSNGVVFACNRPWAVYAGGRVGVGSNGPVPEMYLYVPQVTERFVLRVQANSPNEGGRVVLRCPDGAEAFVFDGELDVEERAEIEVPPDCRGAAWSLTWHDPQTVPARLEDINVFVEGDLTPLLWPERDWATAHGEDLWQRHQAALAEEGAQ